ncbi:MAG TPA: NAD(P)H-binding protein [Steroidobacteraceae bacterium]|nr:NAD(P)H-binding protein [Steroidobacteraceae bacterium]
MAYVITAATGNIGSRVVEHLIAGGIRPRVFVRDSQKARNRFGDRIDLVTGDLGDANALKSALEKNDSLLVINTGPELAARDALAAGVAQEVGIRHLIKLSALSAPQAISVGAWHARGEAAVRASGVPFTIVQPAGFMSNALHWASSIKSRGVVRASVGDGRVAYIHPGDIAAVVAHILTKRAFVGETVPITGPQALTYAEMAAAIGRALGRVVTFESISDEQARDGLVAHGLPAPEAAELVSLWQAVREGRLSTVTTGVERVTGRPPESFDQWATQNAAAFR